MASVSERAPIYPLLSSRKAELIIGIKIEDVGVVGEDGRFVGHERGHFESDERVRWVVGSSGTAVNATG